MVNLESLNDLVPGVEYDVREIDRVVRPASRDALMELLLAGLYAGRLSVHVVVRLPGGMERRFNTLEEVPVDMLDADGAMVRMLVEYVHVKYTVPEGFMSHHPPPTTPAPPSDTLPR